MSILRDFNKIEITKFPGADLFSDAVDRIGATLAHNVEYFLGRVETRRGFGPAIDFTNSDPDRKFTVNIISGSGTPNRIRFLYFWFQSDWRRLMIFNAGDGLSVAPYVTYYNFNLQFVEDVVTTLTVKTVSTVMGEYGSRIFMSFLDEDGNGNDNAKVWNGLFSSASQGPIVEDLFQAPMSNSEFSLATAEPSAGVITAGDHKLGVVFITFNAHETPPTEIPAVFTASGDMNLRITLTPTTTWPLWLDKVKIIRS